jgi:hypothetical protein
MYSQGTYATVSLHIAREQEHCPLYAQYTMSASLFTELVMIVLMQWL